MNTCSELLESLSAAGVEVVLRDRDRVVVRPWSRVPAELVPVLEGSRGELLELLRSRAPAEVVQLAPCAADLAAADAWCDEQGSGRWRWRFRYRVLRQLGRAHAEALETCQREAGGGA